MSEFIGRNLGPYRIVEQVGLGGMATVYKAYQPSMDRYVAIKVLPKHFAADPTFVGRFEQEAKVIAKLENARILPVYDYGEDDGVTYIVMRYLEGGTLTDQLRTGEPGLEEIARIIGQIAEGLDYAHKRGVIHRDMKPSNIMLDHSGDVYITDFGISKLVEGTAQFTGSGIIGTPAYISPEQGLGQPVDHRTDIYSLGVVLYQMATNDVPFHAETPLAVVIKHIHEPLPLPRSINPALPEAVENVILKALAKNPDDRYQSCSEMAAALRKAVGQPGADVTYRRPTAAPSPTRPADAHDYGGTMPVAPLRPSTETRAAEVKTPRRKLWLIPVGLIGALVAICLLGAILMAVMGACPPSGPWPMPPWCGGSQIGTNGVICPPAGPWPMPPGCETPVKPTETPSSQGTEIVPTKSSLPDAVEPLFQDDFAGAHVKDGWVSLNNPGDAWVTRDGLLAFGVIPGTSIGGENMGGASAPMLVFPLPGLVKSFSAQVVLKIAPNHNYQEAGLIILNERSQPMLSLIRGYCDKPDICQGDALYLDNWLKAAEVADYKPVATGAGQLPPDGAVMLRMDVRPGILMAYVKLGDSDWRPAGEWPLAALRVGYVGLVAAAGGQNAERIEADFDDFVVLPVEMP
jgi:predicted Ser/Thr protein kinase